MTEPKIAGSLEAPLALWMAAVSTGKPLRTSPQGVEMWHHVRLDDPSRFAGEWMHWMAWWPGEHKEHKLMWNAPTSEHYQEVPR